MPEDSGTCAVVSHNGHYCKSKAIPDAPFPICVYHLIRAHRFAQDAIDSRGQLGRLEVGIEATMERREREARSASGHGCVYYIDLAGVIKIGYTKNLGQRFANYPPFARLLAAEYHERADLLEHSRLQQFAAHLKHGNEWFHPAPELIEHISDIRRRSPIRAASYRYDTRSPLTH